MRKYKKIDYAVVSKESFERKKYFYEMDLESVRMRLRISSGMVEGIKGNFKDKYRKSNTSITCPSCKQISNNNSGDKDVEKPKDTQNHLLEECVAFDEVRKSLDLETDSGLVSFFAEVVRRRTSIDDNDE